MLLSGVQQSDLIIHVCISYIHTVFFRFFSIIDYYEMLNRVPCARQ